MSTFYEVKTEAEQLAIASSLRELYQYQLQRLQRKLGLERTLLEQLQVAGNPTAFQTAYTVLQALEISGDLTLCQEILKGILAVYSGIEAARRAAPTPSGHPPAPEVTGAHYSAQTGSRTEVKLGLEAIRS